MSCVCPCRGSGDCLMFVLSLLHLLSTGVTGWLAMVSNLRRGVCGSRGNSVQKEYWRVRSRLMGERSGCENSAQSQMCGRNGVVGAATMTSQQVCVGSTGRPSPQGLEKGLLALRRQAGRRTESRKKNIGGRKNKELRARIEVLEKKGGEGAQGGQGFLSRRESGMEEEWGMDMDVEEDEIESRKKLDEQKRKLQEELREIENLSCLSKEVQESLKSNLH